MCRFFKIASILLFVQLTIGSLHGQNNDANDLELEAAEFNFPPLRTVIDSVIKHSAMVGFQNNNIKAKEAMLASEKLRWSENLGLQADTRYGNLNNFSSNEDGEALSQVLTTTKQFNYSMGVFVKFPLFAGINRKNQIKQAEYEMEAAKNMVEFEHEQMKQAVIVLYHDLLLKQKLLRIKSRSLGDGTVNMQMVEKEFRNGIVPISEYVRIKGITTSMEEEYEVAMSEFITAKQRLEEMAGFTFNLIY